MTTDTSAAAVERLAKLLTDTFGFPADEGSPLREHSAATLRALMAERDELIAALGKAVTDAQVQHARALAAALAERDAARAEAARDG